MAGSTGCAAVRCTSAGTSWSRSRTSNRISTDGRACCPAVGGNGWRRRALGDGVRSVDAFARRAGGLRPATARPIGWRRHPASGHPADRAVVGGCVCGVVGSAAMKIFSGFRAILIKEFIIIFRDRTTMFLMFFPPITQLIAFGFALDNDVKHMATVVFDEDRTVESRQFVDQLVNTETFRVVGAAGSVEELSAAIRR